MNRNMKAKYNFSKMESRRNPYASRLKKPVTLRLGMDVVEYFKAMSQRMGISYQNLINLYLHDCAEAHRKITWTSQP